VLATQHLAVRNDIHSLESEHVAETAGAICFRVTFVCPAFSGYGDGFNRLTARTVTAGTLQNYTYAYDRYGNRVSQTPLQGGYIFNPTINAANNHITTSGYTYDAAGNMTSDSVNSYTYDAEGNITAVVDGGSTVSYVYDVFNRRIRVQTPSATNEFVYDYAGRRISTWVASNNFGAEGRIYWDGQQIAYRATDGTTYFDHQDTLGTERMRTTYSGTVGSSYLSLPWGDGYTATVNTTGADQDNNHYAGLERDAESATEHAQFRNYASAQGRWLSPDPYLGSYDISNPQSFNRYSYALNNPASLVDPTGLDASPCGTVNGVFIFCVSTGGSGEGGDNGDRGPSNVHQPNRPTQREPRGCCGGGGIAPNNNYPVPANPCLYAGNSLPPSAYAQTGAADANNPTNYLLDGLKGFPAGHYLDGQVLASGSVGQNRAYGNYTYGAFMAGAGRPLTTALIYANAYAFFKSSYPDQPQMDSTYSYLPAANVANITNGYNAARNGILCHK
jgi:RHS repeat-associated protein